MFEAELHAIAEHSNLGALLNAMICDRVVCGINEDAIQKRLLVEGDISRLTIVSREAKKKQPYVTNE